MGDWRTGRLVHLVFVLVATMCSGAALSLARGNVLGRLYNEVVLDDYDHFLPCEELPSAAQVRRIVEEHEDIVRAIQEINPGHIFVEVDYSSCLGRADIIVSYATHQDRLAIEEILGGHSFYGVPCRFRNI